MLHRSAPAWRARWRRLLGRAVAPRSGIAHATAKFQYQPRQLGDARRIAAREISNPIDLIHGKGLGSLTRAKLAANKAIDLITAKLVKVEANRSSLFKKARPQFFETSAKPTPPKEHAVRAVTAECQIAAEFRKLAIGQPVRLIEQKDRRGAVRAAQRLLGEVA